MKMQTFRKPHQWLNFWLEKYAEVLSGFKYSGEQRKRFWSTLKVFLETLPGNPRNIPLDSVQSFIEAEPAERLLPVLLFYQHIAPSKPHLEMLKSIEASNLPAPSDTSDDPVERFRGILSDRQFSQRTIKNYCTVLAAYLKWLREAPLGTTPEKIQEYCAYLTGEKRLAARTVALHCAALKLYYEREADSGRSTARA